MDVIWAIFLFALGACVGSFLNVVIYRMPRDESIVFPGSHCPSCGRAIRWYDNIPLASWLLLGGRCRYCKCLISPRYLVVEAITALLVGGLWLCFYKLHVREGVGEFLDTWPAYLAHAALLCGLLASALVDIEHWIVPLEVCWFVTGIGIVCATAWPAPPELMPTVSPATGAMALAAAVGLVAALLLVKFGFIQRSFLDAADKPAREPAPQPKPTESRQAGGKRKRKKGKKKKKRKQLEHQADPPIAGVAITKAHGVNPRTEVLREVVFLAPAIVLAIAAGLLVTEVQPVRQAWGSLTGPGGGRLAAHLNGLTGAIFGYLIGGLWIWGFRILGTLGFGKEAMGLGDVHILAAVGAVCGWIAASMAFFLAAFLALAWAVTIFAMRRQRELPYGPWLAGGALVAILFYDHLLELLRPYATVVAMMGGATGNGP